MQQMTKLNKMNPFLYKIVTIIPNSFKIDVWTEMAKEMKQNFGRHQSKSVTKPDSAMGSGGRGSGSSWGMNAIPPLTSAGHSVAIQQQISAHSAAAQEQNNLSIASPGDDDNNDSNNSSIQSNSNSEFSDINDSHGGGGHGPTICQVATVRQRSANTPTPKRNYNQVSWGVPKPSLGGKKTLV